MVTLVVTYVGDGTSRFDREWYDGNHIPLVERTWAPFGFQRAEVFYPVDAVENTDVVALCLCHFTDRAGLDAALAASESAAVMADISNYTDIDPILTVAAASGS
jgi:uncharacterized protein (TIGR02118 family)